MSFGIVLLFVTVTSSLVAAWPLCNESPNDMKLVNQKGFDFKKFAGIWYTIWKSKEIVSDDSVNIKSKVFYENAKGGISYVESELSNNNKFCSSRKTDLTIQDNGVYVSDENVVVRIPITDYNFTSVLVYCTNFSLVEGRCYPDHSFFEILSKKPTIDADIELYRLSQIEEATEGHEMKYLGADCDGDSAIFESIPVTENFSLNHILGDSFALAQTDFTGAKPLLAHNVYLPQIDQVAGWFTMVTNYNNNNSECSPVMRSMTKISPDNNGILYSKIGHLESENRWSVSKTLYSDKDYILSYFCFGEYNRSCSRNQTEVRLDSRRKDIIPYLKRSLFHLLQKVCLTEDNMKDIHYETDCSSGLKEVIDKEQKQFQNSVNGVCKMANMPVYNMKPGEKQMDGIWYNIAGINFVPGNIHTITTLPGIYVIDLNIKDEDPTRVIRRTSAQVCPGKGKFLANAFHYPGPNSSNIYETRLAYMDEQTYFMYICPNENEGVCPKGQLAIAVFSRQKQMTDRTLEKLKNVLPFLCTDISQLKIAEKFPSNIVFQDFSQFNEFDDYKQTPCSVKNIPYVEDLNLSKILGTWYELAHSNFSGLIGAMGPNHTHKVQFSEDTDGRIVLNYKYDDNRKKTFGAFVGTIEPQCEEQHSEYFIAKTSYTLVIVKILYTDYENLAVIYACYGMFRNRECFQPVVHIIGRKPELTSHMLTQAKPALLKACIDPADIEVVEDVSTGDVGHSCKTVKSNDWKRGRHGDS